MKKALVLALCVVGFILIAAPTAVEYAPLFINGKPAGRAVFVNGVAAMSVEDFARAGGATMTLQPYFQRQGVKLLALAGYDWIKHTDPTAEKQVPAVQAGMIKQDVGGVKYTAAPGQIFRVQKAGEISSRVFEFEGKAYLPLADVLRAGGNNAFTGGVFKSNEPLRVSFSTNPNAILIGL